MTFRHIVVPIQLIKGDKHVCFIVFLNFEYGSEAAIFLYFHQNDKIRFEEISRPLEKILVLYLFTQIY